MRLSSIIQFGLLMSWTNKFPFTAIISVLIFLYFIFNNKLAFNLYQSINIKYQAGLLLCYFYFLLSAINYNFNQIFEYGFYRYDGNFFISFLPFLFIGYLQNNVDKSVNLFYQCIKVFAIVTIFVILYNLIIFEKIPLFIINDSFLYFFTFITNNAAGGWLSLCILLIYFINKKLNNKFISILNVVLFCVLITINSRGSLIALMIAISPFIILKNVRYSRLSIYYLSVFILLISVQMYFVINEGMLMYEKIDNIYEYISSNNESTKSANILLRLYYTWPRALEVFLSSNLIFGSGFGSFNDGIESDNNTEFNAHNSFYHLLAETGIIGLLIFVNMLINLSNLIKKHSIDYNFKLMNISILYMIAFVSLTENRFTLPTLILPFGFILLLTISYRKNNNG